MPNYKGTDRKEQHFTPPGLMIHMWENILKKYHHDPITGFLENSAGHGGMVYFLQQKGYPVDAYDIDNEMGRDYITKCNYLKEKIEYKKGRVAFINPPFTQGLKFVYKALEECDYCVSILSINSFLNIDYDKYEVDTIDIFRKYDFKSCKASICVIGIKKK